MRYALVVLLMIAAGCEKDAESQTKVSNTSFNVETLFVDQDGYTVHRFADGDMSHYYVTGPGPATTTYDRVISTGKATVHRSESIQTVK